VNRDSLVEPPGLYRRQALVHGTKLKNGDEVNASVIDRMVIEIKGFLESEFPIDEQFSETKAAQAPENGSPAAERGAAAIQ